MTEVVTDCATGLVIGVVVVMLFEIADLLKGWFDNRNDY